MFDRKKTKRKMVVPISLPPLMLRRVLYGTLGLTCLFCLVRLTVLPSTSTSATTQTQTIKLPNPQTLAQLGVETDEPDSEPNPDIDTADQEEHWQKVTVGPGDTLSKIFHRLGLSTKDVRPIITANVHAKRLENLKPGQVLEIKNNQQQIDALNLNLSPGQTLQVRRHEEGFEVHQKIIPLQKRLAFGKGEIKGTLFLSGKRAGLDQNLLAQLVEIFGWNIDFAIDLKPHDTFRVLYEEKCLDGERIKTGHILAAEIINHGKKFQAVRYTDRSGHSSYFSPDGYGMHQAFLRTPVNFTRISSHFGARNHPILHKIKQHKGVDYAAPYGAPVQATADGKVLFVGQQRGYGKVIELQHGPRYSTFYAHLSRWPANLKMGQAIKQGQIIGFVGQTGLATNTHLHYEFRIDGIHRNPLTVALPRKAPISQTQKPHFVAHAKRMISLMNMHEYKINMAMVSQRSRSQSQLKTKQEFH